MFGESVFTTMRMVDGILHDWEPHFERLKKGVEFVFGPFLDGDDWGTLLRDKVEGRLGQLQGHKIIRMSVYRDQTGRGLRNPALSVADLKIQIHEFPLNQSDERKYKLRTCPVFARPSWWPSYLKTGNYLTSILSQKVYLKEGDDDILFLSSSDTILETSIANIFVVKNDKLYTPPLGPNVLDGIMRRKVLNLGPLHFTSVNVAETTVEQLYRADAVFCSNSVRGLFLVDRIDDHEIPYTEEFLDKFRAFKDKILV